EVARYVPAVRTIPLVAKAHIDAHGPWDAVRANWAVDGAQGDVGGHGTFNLSTGAGTANSTIDVTRFNLADYTAKPNLSTKLTGRVVVDATIPVSDGPKPRWRIKWM